jgi:hypothetical protein
MTGAPKSRLRHFPNGAAILWDVLRRKFGVFSPEGGEAVAWRADEAVAARMAEAFAPVPYVPTEEDRVREREARAGAAGAEPGPQVDEQPMSAVRRPVVAEAHARGKAMTRRAWR